MGVCCGRLTRRGSHKMGVVTVISYDSQAPVPAQGLAPFSLTDMASKANGLRQRAANGNSNGSASKVSAPTDEGKKVDQRLDQHLESVYFRSATKIGRAHV